MSVVAFLLCAAGICILLGFRLPSWSMKARLREFAERAEQERKKRRVTAKGYIARLDGQVKETFLRRTYSEAKQTYEKTGQAGRYQRTLKIALLCGAVGAVLGMLIFRNWMLAVVLGAGLYLLPIWVSQFALFYYEGFLSSELETVLSLVTISYLRNDDILASVEENMNHMNNPVREAFSGFCNTIKYIDANTPAAIEKLKASLDNTLFHQWCDVLILCQENHLLQATLPSIVSKFSDLKAQQEANGTRMMMPLRNAVSMIVLVVSIIPLLYFVNVDWYSYLITTFFGQFSLTLTALTVFATLHKAIRLSKPITYEV